MRWIAHAVFARSADGHWIINLPNFLSFLRILLIPWFLYFLHTLHLSNGNLFGNVALEAAYHYGMDWVNQQNEYLEGNRDFMLEFFSMKMPKIRMVATEATYLAWMDLREYGLGEAEMNRLLIDKAGVVLNRGSIYGKEGEGFFRLNFACPRQLLEEALIQMEQVLGS